MTSITFILLISSVNFLKGACRQPFDMYHHIHILIQGAGMYSKSVKQTEEDIQNILKRVNELTGIKESDTGLAPPALWDLAADKQTLQS